MSAGHVIFGENSKLGVSREYKEMLTFKRTYISSDTGPWSMNKYNVFESDQHIGGIMLDPQGPRDQQWFWTITARVPKTLPTAVTLRRASKRWKILSANG